MKRGGGFQGMRFEGRRGIMRCRRETMKRNGADERWEPWEWWESVGINIGVNRD